MTQLKKCKNCLELKELSEYSPHKKSPFGRQPQCKSCRASSGSKRNKTKDGLITNIYSTQRKASRRRGHPLPPYNLTDLREWAMMQPIYHELHAKWVASGYDKNKTPSIDRKDDYKGYSFDNIQLMTWSENHEKYNRDRMSGVNNKQNKSVSQYTKEGVFVREFFSIGNASRVTKTHSSNIASCCRGAESSAGGFIWKYADE